MCKINSNANLSQLSVLSTKLPYICRVLPGSEKKDTYADFMRDDIGVATGGEGWRRPGLTPILDGSSRGICVKPLRNLAGWGG